MNKQYIVKRILNISLIILIFSGISYAIVPDPYNYSYFSQGDYPELLKISAPIPNPVVDYAEIWYNIPEDDVAEIAIYNFAGVKLKSIPVSGGLRKVNFEAYDLQEGVYFVCLIYKGKNVDSKKLIKK
ncbi:MAG: hypothetical protein C0596_02365 [Marinilabiliales bacterium]|nr:MAG: hypothetical protein C0596_02365 [Marinilabiliales bacterium]